MIDVSVSLRSTSELKLFMDFMDTLLTHRTPRSQPLGPILPLREELGEIVRAAGVSVETPKFVAAPGAIGPVAPHPAIDGPTQAQLEAALRAFGTKHGFPAARTILDEFTKGKLGDVPADQRSRLYERLTK